MKRFWVICFLIPVLSAGLQSAWAEESGWPRTIPVEQGEVKVYAPQVETFESNTLRFRAALAWFETPDSEPVFGAGWFESDVVVDTLSRTVHPTGMDVVETRFPEGMEQIEQQLSYSLSQPSSAWSLDFTLDELQTSLDSTQAERQAAQQLNTAPPKIIYRDKPALLVTLDGNPVLRTVENSDIQAVINTPYPLLHDGRYYYLNVTEDVWYRADSATGPYRFDARTPDTIKALVDAGEKEEPAAAEQVITAANAPEIVVSTEPAELIVTEGPAAFVPLVDDLLVLQNSDDDVFMHLSEQEYYIVLAGRWYRSDSLDGPWTFQSSDQLPAAFANIPRDSSQADSRVYVAGTAEAEDAVLDAQVPQTAVVQRGEVDMQVDYDGDPQFAPVDGTGMRYANNSGSTVILSDGLYYLVEDGVWYVSTTANGPWQVATQRPAQVVTILPTSPVYNVKYVHVYHSTPNVVYVGYTPGYFGSYVYHGTVFYGSGWYYRPWVSPYTYYPRPSTWGFHVSYNPWYGWGFGVSWGWGPFSFNYWSGGYWHHHHHWHHRHYGYWGPRGYRPRHGHGYGRHRYAHNRPRPEPYGRHDNLYRDSRQRARVVDSRDRYSGGRSGRYDDSKLANLSSSRQKKKQAFTRDKNVASLKPAPIPRSDLRAKARQRNAAFEAQPAKLMAANTAKPKSARYQKSVSSEKAPQQKQYKAPQQKQYKAPQQKQYKAPQQKQYKAPQQKQYKAPQQKQYKAPQQKQYKAPQQKQYKAPQQKQYKAPQQKQYKAPQQKQYKAPQVGLKASNRGGIDRRQGFNERKRP